MTTKISVIIPTYKRPELLQRCINALLEQRLGHSEYEIIVCDDEPNELTEALVFKARLTSLVAIKYLAVTSSQGPAAARNRGAEAASSDLLAFTDDDCIPDRLWLRSGIARFNDPVISAVSGKVIVLAGNPPTDYQKNESGLEKAEFVTANLLMRSEIFRRLGGFDERFTSAWREDSELHFRMLEQGHQIQKADDAVVFHPVRPAYFGVSIAQQQKSKDDALLYKLHPYLYRRLIGRYAPGSYYLFAIGLVLLVSGLIERDLLILGFILVFFCWSSLILKRLRGTSKYPLDVVEVAITSALIPVVSLYWRVRGGIEYKVSFFD